MRIHKEGYSILLMLLIIQTVANAILISKLSLSHMFALTFLIVSVIIFIAVLWFFRLPLRKVNYQDNAVIAPADGKVLIIEEVEEPEYFKQKRLKVAIFMSPLNVHVNLYPISGVVKYFKYHAGKYLVAWHPKSSEKNERTTVVIDDGKNELLVRQIAGAVARRIVCYSLEGESVKQGEELGFIKFGSRVDIYMPLDAKVSVKLGQKVKGKRTVIAQLT